MTKHELTKDELKAQVVLLTNLLTTIYNSEVKYPYQHLNKQEICKIMSWTDGQFRYRIPELKRYGMINAGGFRMKCGDLQNYIMSFHKRAK